MSFFLTRLSKFRWILQCENAEARRLQKKKGEGGRERKISCGGRAWPAGQGVAWKSFCWRRKEAPNLRTWVAKDGVAHTRTLDVFNKLVTRRTPADLSSTEHLTVLNNNILNKYL